MGMGRGMGTDALFNQGSYPGPQVLNRGEGGVSTDEELDMLKQQAEALNQQIEQIKNQITELEKRRMGK